MVTDQLQIRVQTLPLSIPTQVTQQTPHMAYATVISTSDLSLQLDSIPTVDLRLLSQPELYALSRCSAVTALHPCRRDDVVIPKIDRSVFNESAGSRKQTYSPLRFAPAASTTTIHRRTPHLRSSKPPLNISVDDSDPERAENSQILSLLKQLLSSETSGNDLVPIRVEYSDSVPELSNAVNIVRKRKRGRPRKDENAVVPVAVVGGYDVIKDIFVCENVEDRDRDRENVNKNGVVVDIKALGDLEDPYGAELRRRTEGMATVEELLGFLGGLNGQWGSRRRKKRIVGASDFGDALPKGWKLLLSLKRKEGRVWLICRRYISPSGRQFVSCKEVSSYLLSIFGLEDTNQPNCSHSNEGIQFVYEMASRNAVDLAVPEDHVKENSVCHSSLPIPSMSRTHEKQVTLKIVDPLEVQVGETLNCRKCMTTFDGKDDLLHHQLLSHRRKRSKIGTYITDGVIIKSGQYECQFCHKKFNERNRYNGHIGAHVKNDVKSAKISVAVNEAMSVDPVSLGGVPHMEPFMQESIGEDSDVVSENFDANANDELNSDSSHSKLKADSSLENYTDKFDHDHNFLPHDKQDLQATRNENILPEESSDNQDRVCTKSNDIVGGEDEATDIIVAKSDLCLGSEAALSNNENKGDCETCGETKVPECAANKVNECLEERERIFESYLPSPLPNEQTFGGVEKNVIGVSASVDEPSEEAVSESGLPTPSGNEKRNGIEKMDDSHFSSTMGEFKLDCEKSAENGSIFGSKGCPLVLSGNEKFNTNDNVNGVITSIRTESVQKRGSDSSILAPSGDEETRGVECNINRVSTSSKGPRLDGIYDIGSNECGSNALSDTDVVTSLEEEKRFESCSVVSSWGEPVRVIEKYGNEGPTCMVEQPRQQKSSQSSLLSLSGYEQNCGVENHADKVAPREVVPKLNEVQTLSHSKLGVDVMTSSVGRSLEFCSLVPSGNGQTFDVQDNGTGVYKQENSESGLLTRSCISEISDNVHIVNKIYSTPVDELKFDEVQNLGNRELSLGFGSPHAGLYVDTSAEQEKYSANCFVIPTEIEQTFGVQTNLSRVNNNSMVENPKQGIGSLSGSFSLSLKGETFAFENNFNTVYTSRDWEGPKVDEVRNSENDKFMIGFGSSHGQRDADVPGGSWRTSEEQSGLADISNPLVQSSSSVLTFDILSDKGEDGLFRLDEKYDRESAFEGLRSGRTEPVEFSFLTTHNSNSLQGDSKVFSYDTEMEQEFDSSFWLGKDALMPNIGGRDQVITTTTTTTTSVCVWCRNEFHQEAVHSGTQISIGSMCPICRARISEQVNVL